MIGVHSGKFNGKDGGVPTIIEPKPVTPNEPKDKSRQLTWKFYTKTGTAFQLDIYVRPLPSTATSAWQDSTLQSILEAQINGVRIHAVSVTANLHKHPADVTFSVAEEHDLLELLESTFYIRVSEAGKGGALTGHARMDKQTLAAPEHCSGGGVEPLRRLTWRCIYHHTCYYLTLTVLQRFARSQISINGFVLESRKHSLLTQLPFKAAKFDVVVEEPGLGDIYGTHIVLKAQLKDDEVAATGHVGSQPLNVPKTFRGNAHIILPLVQAEPASSGPLDRSVEIAELLGDAPKGWVPPQTVLKLQKQGKHRGQSTLPPHMQSQASQQRYQAPAEDTSGASTSEGHPTTPPLSRMGSSRLYTVPESSVAEEDTEAAYEAARQSDTPAEFRRRPVLDNPQAGGALSSPWGLGPGEERLSTQSSDGLSEFSSTAVDTAPGWQERGGYRSSSNSSLPRGFSLDEATRQPGQGLRYSLDEATQKVAESSPFSGPPQQRRPAAEALAPFASTPSAGRPSTPAQEEPRTLAFSSSDTLTESTAGQRTGVHWGPWSAGSSQEGAAQPPQDLQHRKHSWSASETAPMTQPQQEPARHTHAARSTTSSRASRTSSGPLSEHVPGTADIHTPEQPRFPAVDTTRSLGWEEVDRDRGSDDRSSGHSGAAAAEMPPLEHDPKAWIINKSDLAIARTESGRKMRIGEGSTGVVYKALMHGCDEVAVKIVRAAHPTAKELAVFQREIQTLHALRHRNIVQFYGACLEPDCLAIVTELMNGGDMYTALRRCPDMMHWDRMGKRIALDVALGLNHLHSRRPAWMHRDLKSPNVLLTREGVAKIADVGLMRAQEAGALATAQSSWTPLWAAPEVVRLEHGTVKADIWSYGICIFELVSQQNIADFPSYGMACQMKSVAQGQLLRLPRLCPAVAARIFYACTQMNPEERPSALDIVNWLRDEE